MIIHPIPIQKATKALTKLTRTCVSSNPTGPGYNRNHEILHLDDGLSDERR
jgi:hypothetical protein